MALRATRLLVDRRQKPAMCVGEDQVRMHQGYEVRPEDLIDVRPLCDRFGLAWPWPQ